MLAVVLLIFLVYMFIWVPLFTGSLFIIFLFAPGLILLGPLSSKCLGFMGDSIQYCPIDQSLLLCDAIHNLSCFLLPYWGTCRLDLREI